MLASEGTVKNLKIRDFCLEGNYSGAIAGQNEGKIIGSIDSGTYSGGIVAYADYGTFDDCYYLSGCVKSGNSENSSADGITAKTADQFASGEVAYLLNGDQSTITFKQTLGTDAYPSFTGGTVYQVENCKEEPVYSNTNENIGHQWVNGTCTVCDLVCDHTGSTHTVVTDNGDGTHGYTCTVCGAVATGEHTGGTATCTTLAVCDTCGKEYGELAAHTPDTNGKCTVDGCGYQYAAKVGDSFYETIHKALRAAEGINGCTLTLLDDVTLTSMSSYASYVNTGTFTLDLNGKTLSSNKSTLEVMGSADLTIRDSIGGGKIVSTDSSAVYLSGGKLTIESGTFEGTLDGVFLSGTSTLIVKGGTFTGSRAMITGFGSNVEIDLTAIDPSGLTLKNNGSGTFAPKLPEGYGMVGSDGKLLSSLSAEQSATVHKHEYKYTDLGDGNHQQACSCGLTTGEPAAHSTTAEDDKAATCIAPAYCSVCDSEYGDVDKTNHDETVEYTNGFCTECDAYEPAELKDGYYQIKNGGNLFWYANYINTVDRTANAVLVADIDLENRPWTPIGSTGENSNNFRGVFDGQGYTIKGLYVEGGRAGLGFFGEVRTGTVKNFTIYGNVVVNTEVNYVGGVIGSICGLNSTDHGLERNGAIIQNITSFVNVTAKAHGIGMIGGFVGYANHQSLIENCSWYGTFDAGVYRVDSGAGGFIGKIQENTSEVTIRNCGAYGTIKTNYAGDYNNTATIYMGGFLSFSNTNAQTTIENCLFAGKFERGDNLTDQAFLGAFGTLRSVNAIKNCYYLGDDGLEAVHSDSNLKPGSDNVDITSVSTAQLLSGEIAYLLQEVSEIWGQKIGTDDYPVLGGETVYYGYVSCADDAVTVYTNDSTASDKKPAHNWSDKDGICANGCGERAFNAINGMTADGENRILSGIAPGSESLDGYTEILVDGIGWTLENGVGTGCTATLGNTEEVFAEYTILIFGDVNGDGWYDGQDAVLVSCLSNGMLTKESVGEAVYMAADCNHDGVIDQFDVDLLNQAGTLLANVDQTKPSEVLLETSSEYVEYLDLIDQSPEIEIEDETDTPEADTEDAKIDIFEMILNFIKSIFEMLLSYIPMPM